MYKTEEIHESFDKQIGIRISDESRRQQTPAYSPSPLEHAHALGNVLLDIIFRGAENDPDHGDIPHRRKPARQKQATEKR
jgi:hypothetical protein